VELDMDWDDRGILGIDGAPVATTGKRFSVNVYSAAPVDEVQAIIDEGLKIDPWLHTFSNAQTLKQVVTISNTSGV
jgi:hypothetical protein